MPSEKKAQAALIERAILTEISGKTAVAMGRKGGMSRSPIKLAKIKENAKKGGRPPKKVATMDCL